MEEKNLHNEIQDELGNISPTLADAFAKKNRNTIPPDYFNQLQVEVFKSLSEEVASHDKLIPIKRISSWRMLLAAASILGVIFISTFLLLNKSIESQYDLVNLNEEEINTYLIDHAYELDDEHLSQLPFAYADADLLELSEEEIQPILEDYLYQIENSELN